jgi:hypothetical protein
MTGVVAITKAMVAALAKQHFIIIFASQVAIANATAISSGNFRACPSAQCGRRRFRSPGMQDETSVTFFSRF